MSYPTKPGDRKRRRKAAAPRGGLPSGRSRAKPTAPELYVRDASLPFSRRYCQAHLRNRGGYLYLAWRAGEKVRNYYLGKAPRNSPTARGAVAAQVPTSAPAARDLARRAKTR